MITNEYRASSWDNENILKLAMAALKSTKLYTFDEWIVGYEFQSLNKAVLIKKNEASVKF